VCQGYCLDASSYEQAANFANAKLYFSSVLMSVYSLQLLQVLPLEKKGGGYADTENDVS